MSNPCKSGYGGALRRYAMLASSPTCKVCLGRCTSRALHCIRLADFFRGSQRCLTALAVLLVLIPAQAATETYGMPKLDIGKGGHCVADPQWMRVNHMKVLFQQRDETVHLGIRDGKYSLKNCIECHASLRDNSVIGRADSFCEGCHRYEAVKIDCFECHSSKRSTALAQEVSK
jgi:hypothetical protein